MALLRYAASTEDAELRQQTAVALNQQADPNLQQLAAAERANRPDWPTDLSFA